MGGCSPQISREHSISHAALKILADGDVVDIGGLKWMPEEQRKMIPSTALASKVLCANHNGALSELDLFAQRFADCALRAAQTLGPEQRSNPISVDLFNGHDLERWLIKCLCGLVASENAEAGRSPGEERWKPSERWLDYLFGLMPFQQPHGLYYLRPRSAWKIHQTFSISALTTPEVGVYGLTVSFYEKEFLLAMTRPSGRKGSLLEGAVYRPSQVWTTNGVNNNILQLGWSGPHTASTVEVEFKGLRRRKGSDHPDP